jgi:hypothetical protein
MAPRHGAQSSAPSLRRAEEGREETGACSLHISTRADTLVLCFKGRLDAVAGRLLLRAVESADAPSLAQLEVDVGGVTSFTPDGAAALAACRHRMRGRFPGGLHYLADTPVGHQVLLAAASPAMDVTEAVFTVSPASGASPSHTP